MTRAEEPPPEARVRVLCRHPYFENKRAYVTPTSVHCMHNLYWADGEIKHPLPTWIEARTYVQQQMHSLRKDHQRYLNPTPYKVSISDDLFSFMHQLWMKNVPIGELY
jgi:nicotinate phosphoribosyltransferase